MITFLLVVHTLIALSLVAVILLQRSEGGGLGIGGGTGGGMMSARGAANLLSRSTTVLATLFIGTSIVLAVLAAGTNKRKEVDVSLVKAAAPLIAGAPATTPAPSAVPIAGPETVPAPVPGSVPRAVPIAGAVPTAPAGVPLAR